MQWVPTYIRKPDRELLEYRKKYGDELDLEVIVFIEGAEISTQLSYDGYGFYTSESYDDYPREYYSVTHWMPMPPKPADCLVNVDLGDQIEANFELIEAILT